MLYVKRSRLLVQHARATTRTAQDTKGSACPRRHCLVYFNDDTTVGVVTAAAALPYY